MLHGLLVCLVVHVGAGGGAVECAGLETGERLLLGAHRARGHPHRVDVAAGILVNPDPRLLACNFLLKKNSHF